MRGCCKSHLNAAKAIGLLGRRNLRWLCCATGRVYKFPGGAEGDPQTRFTKAIGRSLTAFLQRQVASATASTGNEWLQPEFTEATVLAFCLRFMEEEEKQACGGDKGVLLHIVASMTAQWANDAVLYDFMRYELAYMVRSEDRETSLVFLAEPDALGMRDAQEAQVRMCRQECGPSAVRSFTRSTPDEGLVHYANLPAARWDVRRNMQGVPGEKPVVITFNDGRWQVRMPLDQLRLDLASNRDHPCCCWGGFHICIFGDSCNMGVTCALCGPCVDPRCAPPAAMTHCRMVCRFRVPSGEDAHDVSPPWDPAPMDVDTARRFTQFTLPDWPVDREGGGPAVATPNHPGAVTGHEVLEDRPLRPPLMGVGHVLRDLLRTMAPDLVQDKDLREYVGIEFEGVGREPGVIITAEVGYYLLCKPCEVFSEEKWSTTYGRSADEMLSHLNSGEHIICVDTWRERARQKKLALALAREALIPDRGCVQKRIRARRLGFLGVGVTRPTLAGGAAVTAVGCPSSIGGTLKIGRISDVKVGAELLMTRDGGGEGYVGKLHIGHGSPIVDTIVFGGI